MKCLVFQISSIKTYYQPQVGKAREGIYAITGSRTNKMDISDYKRVKLEKETMLSQ